MGHHQAITPHCITQYRLWADGNLIADVEHNHHAVCEHRFITPLTAKTITLEILGTAGARPAVYALNVR